MDTQRNIEYDEDRIDSLTLAQIDEEVKRVMGALGHSANDFSASVSAERLGRQYGVYGSFIPPTWERFDLQPPINLPLAASPKAPSDSYPFMTPGTAAPSMENKKA